MELTNASFDKETTFDSNIYGKIETFNAAQIFDLIGHQELRPSKERPSLKEGEPVKVLLVYPTTKLLKQAPLKAWITSQIKALLARQDISVQIKWEEKSFEVKNTDVGEQPYHPKGFVGAWNRITHCRKQIEPVEDYHAIFFLSAESDFSKTDFLQDNDHTKEPPYDAPNIIIWEYFTGFIAAGRGQGPTVPSHILEAAQAEDFIDNEKLCGNCTAGTKMEETYRFPAGDWHKFVCGISRKEFLERLLEKMVIDVSLFKDLLPQPSHSLETATPSAPRRPGLG